jgi:hypothetical protein
MSDSNPTLSAPPVKPAKPRPDFPLFPHATGRWAKKFRGQLKYSGPWDDPKSAEDKYLAQKDALHAGRKPREQVSAGVTIKALCNAFLALKLSRVGSGELSPLTFDKYKQVAELIVKAFGKHRLVADVGPATGPSAA